MSSSEDLARWSRREQVVTAGLMAEVGEALVATAIGILVALPAIALYNYLLRRVQALLAGSDVLSNLILAYLVERREPEGR